MENKNLDLVILKYKNQEFKVKKGMIISDALRLIGKKVETPCNCMGICKKCQVKVKGELSSKEEMENNLGEGIRLACISKILGDVEVFLLEELDSSNLKITEKEILLNRKDITIDKKKKGKVLAIDIGTTGVSARLIDLEKGEIIGSYSGLNYQSEYGADVLSRITYGIKNGILDLQNSILNQIKDIIRGFKCNIDRIGISGNTTMQHLIYGENPKSLAISPYTPIFLEEKQMLIDNIETTLLPSASSYVGADIIAGVVATELEEKDNTLFVDIGTNGEIVLSSNGKLYGTSTAAGPAFEGTNIECGMRAEKGAIEKFLILGEEEEFEIKTIENITPKGICGSGLIDIISELVRKKIVLKSGKLNPRMDVKFKERLKEKRFYITENIYISQKDIRQIQLAKGAVAGGIKSLLLSVDMDISNIKEVIIAGSFGYHLDLKSIINIGLIPNYNGKISFVGNTSLDGCIGYLTNKEIKEKIRKTKIEVLELSRSSEFQEIFIKELKF